MNGSTTLVISDPLLSLDQCYDFGRGTISKSFLRKKITSGDIPSVRHGRNIRVRLSALEAYLSTGDA